MFNKKFKKLEDLILLIDKKSQNLNNSLNLFIQQQNIINGELSRERETATHQTHNLEKVGSTPTPATDDFDLDSEDEKEWLVKCNDDKGFKSYVKLRDLVLLKKISIAIEQRDFQLALELNGRRCEILKLLSKAKEEADKSELEG